MKTMTKAALIAAVLAVAGCQSAVVPASPQQSAEFKTGIAAPAGLARVYVLPTRSKGLMTELNGHASVALFPDGSDRGALMGATSKDSFVAFDITPGTYDVLAYGDDPFAKTTHSLTFDAGKVYFLRPSFFRTAAEMPSNPDVGYRPTGMGFDDVPPDAARAEIGRLTMAALTPEGKAFLTRMAQARTAPAALPAAMPVAPPPAPAAPVPQAAAPAAPPAPAAAQTAPAPADAQATFATIERKLKELRRLRQENLITQDQYDAKRKALLDAY
ncbi:MAG: hypothetical protein M0006_17700 [Magnetospirillum sp.]|nr:hypothetical protein [Magnetospirillum sp.]